MQIESYLDRDDYDNVSCYNGNKKSPSCRQTDKVKRGFQ